VAEGDRRARDEVLYGLDESGLDFSAERYPLTQLIREDPGGYLGLVLVNVRQLLRTVFLWRLIPTPLALLVLWVIWRERRNRVVLSLAVAGLLPVASALAFFVLPRYLVVTAALADGLCGLAVARLPTRFQRPAIWASVAMVGVTIVMAAFGPTGLWSLREPLEQRKAGEWLEANTDPEDRIMTRSQVVAFYADRETVALPYAAPDTTLNFGRHFGARYLVADEFILWEWRPQLRYLFGEGPWPGLRLVHQEEAQGRVLRIFALDPPPEEVADDDHLPTLAHMGDGSPAGSDRSEKSGN
jgi:hypothetical protein